MLSNGKIIVNKFEVSLENKMYTIMEILIGQEQKRLGKKPK